jgi:20S proteasome alpha/beta subunit
MYKIDSHIACAVAGLTSDANILINRARLVAQYHRLSFQEGQPVELLIQNVCDVMQSYTQFGGQRPFGVSFLFAGWDEHYGYQLYHSDPSGNYGGWNATAIGNNSQVAMDFFKKECKGEKNEDGEDTMKDPPTYKDGLALAIKVRDASRGRPGGGRGEAGGKGAGRGGRGAVGEEGP